MSEDLKQFLTGWLEWVNSGGKQNKVYSQHGLCSTLISWAHEKYPYVMNWDARLSLQNELRKILYSEYGTTAYPFGGGGVYYEEIRDHTTHLNPLRLEWVKGKLNQ